MAATPSPAVKTERLLNLVIALLWTRRPLSKAQIRQAVPQYQETASPEAFDRMFERDKDELRDLGIPLVTQPLDPLYDDELGYRIDRREYALAPIDVEPDEVAALALAARAWSQASLSGAATMALNKLRAAGVEIDDRSIVAIEPSIRTAEAAFDAMKSAILARRPVAFDYRKRDGERTRRTMQPWGLTMWRGRWYVTGYDLDRAGERVFRLSRVATPVKPAGAPGSYDIPAGHVPRVLVSGAAAPKVFGEVRLRAAAGHLLRRRAESVSPVEDGWDRVVVGTTDLEMLADDIAALGPDAVALSPSDLVDQVRQRLSGALAAHRADRS